MNVFSKMFQTKCMNIFFERNGKKERSGPMRPLIFSASIGHGHEQAAKALKNELEIREYQPEIIDTFQSLSPMLHKIMLQSYLRLLKKNPTLWRKIYFHAQEVPHYLWLDKFALLFTDKLNKLLDGEEIPFLISTHPFVTAFLTTLKRKKQLDIPLYTVITDYVLHPAYYREEIDGYFTADTNMQQFSERYNIPSEKFTVSGIPVPPCDSVNQSKWKIRYDLQLPHDSKIVLVAGGGIGLTNYEEVIQSLEKCQRPFLVLCMTGYNLKAYEKVSALKSKHEIKVIKYTDKFLDYLKASDVVISKAGGLTMTEALLCETPILVYQPVPGHEEENAAYLVGQGAALKADTDEQISILTKRILYNEKIKKSMKQAAKKLKTPDAAQVIVEQIVRKHDDIRDYPLSRRKLSVYR